MDALNNALLDYYRCDEALARFALVGELSARKGYFTLGSDTTCYGRLSSGRVADSFDEPLDEVTVVAQSSSKTVALKFDPSEIVENLRRERYVSNLRRNGITSSTTLRALYYAVRPILPIFVRRHFQRLHLQGWEKISFPRWPVDVTVESIQKKLLAFSLKAQGLQSTPFVWFWPEGHTACAVMTHDVETSSGKNFCPQLMDLDDSFGVKSSFQFVPEKRYSVPQALLDTIRDRGFEINVHDLYHDASLYSDRETFQRLGARINQHAHAFGARGFRAGALYRNSDWYDALEFAYDMSISNVSHLDPQPGGCCTVMPYFIGKIVELPVTTTQDYTLFHLLNDYSIRLWQQQLQKILAENGLASFIVHPDYVTSKRARSTYTLLLQHLSQLRAECGLWLPLPGEVESWWRLRSKMTVIRTNGEWRIEGEGKEKAQIAYATLVGDSVVYSIPDESAPVRPSSCLSRASS